MTGGNIHMRHVVRAPILRVTAPGCTPERLIRSVYCVVIISEFIHGETVLSRSGPTWGIERGTACGAFLDRGTAALAPNLV